MFPRLKDSSLRVIGVALEGSDGMPVVVLKESGGNIFLPVSVDPFDAETVIRSFLDEDEDDSVDSALFWLADSLKSAPPRKALIELQEDGRYRVRFITGLFSTGKDRLLPFGAGLVLCRILEIPLTASDILFENSREELSWLSNTGTFLGDFLYLSPTQYAPRIPVE